MEERAAICPRCKGENTYLMEKESKGWQEDGFAWHGCKDCEHRFMKKVQQK